MTIEWACNSVAEPFAKNWIELAFIIAFVHFIDIIMGYICYAFHFSLAVHYLLS